MALPIPRKHVRAMANIRGLPDSAIDELIRSLETAPVMPTAQEMTAHITSQIHAIPSDELAGIVDAIYALYHVREYAEMPKRVFLQELTEGVVKETGAVDNPSAIRERFRRLLDIGPLKSIAKAVTLQRDANRLFCGARVISDIRPVFGTDVASDAVGAVICHTLKLGYHEEGHHKEIFVVLDEEDLDTMSTVIERARIKSKTLSDFLDRAKLPRLGV